MKFIVLLVNCISITFLLLFGLLFTPRVINNMKDSETRLVKNEFNLISDDITKFIESNLTDLYDQSFLSIVDVDRYFTRSNETYYQSMTIPPPKIDDIRLIMNNIVNRSKFTIFSIAVSKNIKNKVERDSFLQLTKDIYRDQSMIIFGIRSNGSIYQVDDNQFPLQLLTLLNLPDTRIGVPSIGLLDIYSLDPFNEIDILLNMTDDDYNLGRVSNIPLQDGSSYRNIAMNVNYRDWLISVTFDPDTFLSNIINDSDQSGINVIILESIYGVFYNNSVIKASNSDLTKEHVFNFFTINWMIEYQATDKFFSERDTGNEKIFVVIFVLLYVIIFIMVIITNYAIKYSSQKEIYRVELNLLRKIKIRNHTIHYILHEIRNLLSAPFSLFTIIKSKDELDEESFDLIKDSINSSVKLSTNILDFEQLILNKYKSKLSNVDLL